jgi:CXXC-20-CXXC protein
MRTMFRLKCPYCDVKQYESAASRKKTWVISALPAVLLPLYWFTDISIKPAIMILIVLYLLVFSYYPFVMKLSNEQEPFW